jgi:hypothetical protein
LPVAATEVVVDEPLARHGVGDDLAVPGLRVPDAADDADGGLEAGGEPVEVGGT